MKLTFAHHAGTTVGSLRSLSADVLGQIGMGPGRRERPMRITFVTPYAGLGGGIRAVAMYAGELAKLGHQVTVVSAGPKIVPFKSRVADLIKGRGWWRPEQGPSHLDGIQNITWRKVDCHRPITAAEVPDGDVIIATWWETAEWIRSYPASKGAKVYFVQHHEVVFNNQPVERVRATYRLPLFKICCAGWLRDLMASEYGDPTAVVVPYGIDHETFNSPVRSKQQRPTVGFMYSTATFKAVDVAIEACEIARRRLPNLRVIAFGEAVRQDQVALPDWIECELRPPQKRIAELYGSCDAWLFPSRCEGFGLPILEAMACRTPVIGTPTGIAPDAIGEGGGILTKMVDAADMAEGIIRFAQMDPLQWLRLSDAAVATAGRFRWDWSARVYEAYLIQALASVQQAA